MPIGQSEQDVYTVPISSPTVPVKIFGAGPFFIVNSSFQATVWVGDTRNISDGHGVPLYPGTGMNWIGSQGTGETWAILGQDTNSVGQSAGVIVGLPVTDWQPNPIAVATAVLNSGVILVDQPAIIASLSLNGGTSYQSSVFNISTYQSIVVRVVRSGTPAHTFDLNFNWLDAPLGNILGVDSYRWTSADVTGMQTTIPCRGAFLTVSVQTAPAAVSADTVIILGSHRPWNSLMSVPGLGHTSGLGVPDSYGSRLLCTAVNAAVASGGQLTATPTDRYDGPIIITAISFGAAAAAPHLLEGVDAITGFGFAYDQPVGQLALAANRAVSTLHAVAPRNTWSVSCSNLAGAAQQIQIEVVAAPEGS